MRWRTRTRAGIIHRDVKPDNVLLADRHVSLADFGVAHALAAHVGEDQTVTGTSVMVGTPAYMSPEQVTAAAIDGRSDIYAFGVMAYELLAGAPPFRGTRQDVVTAHLTESPVPLTTHRAETPAALANAIMRCLHKKPDQRWQRIDDLLPVLDAITAVEGPTPHALTPTARPPMAVRGGSDGSRGPGGGLLRLDWSDDSRRTDGWPDPARDDRTRAGAGPGDVTRRARHRVRRRRSRSHADLRPADRRRADERR